MNFRKDINGLRAIAVLSVMLFHLDFAVFSGGFVGVDVFFVISGFLMTGIIYTKLEKGTFNFWQFFMARVRRILPALTALILVLTALGYKYLIPSEYHEYAGKAFSSLLMYSNIQYASKADYFDTLSEANWLLHTWSLSAEWQFYLVFPFILAGLRKFKAGAYFTRGLMGLFLFSLALSILLTKIEPTAAFFILPTRICEFLVGTFVFLYRAKFAHMRYMLEAGLGIIAITIFTYGGAISFPSAYAILPALGAGLVIASEKRSKILDNPIAQYFGKISYSLYLWHWPVAVAMKYLEIEGGAYTQAGAFALSVLLAQISYSLVESVFREHRSKKKEKQAMLGLGILFNCALAFLLMVIITHGLYSRVPPEVRDIDDKHLYETAQAKECNFKYKKRDGIANCVLGNANTIPSIAVWGDSHANSSVKGVVDVAIERGRSLNLYSHSGCPPILGLRFLHKGGELGRCAMVNELTYEYLADNQNIKDIFLIARWPSYVYGYNEHGNVNNLAVFSDKGEELSLDERLNDYVDNVIKTACGLEAAGKRVHIVGASAEMGVNVPTALAKSLLIRKQSREIIIPRTDFDARNKKLIELFKGSKNFCKTDYIDVTDYFCDKDKCRATLGGRALYQDDDHLNMFGAERLEKAYSKALGR